MNTYLTPKRITTVTERKRMDTHSPTLVAMPRTALLAYGNRDKVCY